jgi:hypothetical protein
VSGPNGHRVPPGSRPGQIAQPPSPVQLEALQAQFETARDANNAKLAELQRQGLEMDPLSFVHARIDRLIDSIAQFAGPNGPRWMLTARLSFEQHIAAELEVAETEGRKAQLALGASWTPGMIAALARESGMFRRRT